MTPYQKRLKLARIIFILAIVLYAIAHFLPLVSTGLAGGIPIWMGWLLVWLGLSFVPDSAESMRLMGIALLPVIFTLFLLAAPFICTLLSKARPLLWISRLLITGVTLGFGYCAGGIIRSSMLDPGESLHDIGSGSYLLYAAMALVILGFFLIPNAKAQDATLLS